MAIKHDFVDELEGQTAVLAPQDYIVPPAPTLSTTKTSGINREYVDSLIAGEHKEVQESKVIPAPGPEGLPIPGIADPKDVSRQPAKKPIGFVESAKEEFTRPAKGAQYVPGIGGVVGSAEQLLYLDAGKRLSKDFDYSKPIRPEQLMPGAMGIKPARFTTRADDQKLIEDLWIRTQDQQERGYTFGGKVAKGLLNLPTWMAEFAMTGGLASLGSKAAQEAGEKLIKNYAKTKIGRIALKGMGWTGGAITRATLGLAPRIAEKAIGRQVNVQILGADQEGWATSFAKAWGDVTIEAASETAGQAITGFPVKLLNKTKFGSKFLNVLRSGWMKATGGKAAMFAKKMATTGGYSNLIGEYGEERLASLLRGLTDVDDFGAGKDANVVDRLVAAAKQDFDPTNIAVEFTVLGAIPAGQVALGAAGRVGQAFKAKPKPTPFEQRSGEIMTSAREDLQNIREEGGIQALPKFKARIDEGMAKLDELFAEFGMEVPENIKKKMNELLEVARASVAPERKGLYIAPGKIGPAPVTPQIDKSEQFKSMSEAQLREFMDTTKDPELQRLAQVEFQGRSKPAKTPATEGVQAPQQAQERLSKPEAVEVAPLPNVEDIIKLTPESPELKKVIADISQRIDVAFRQDDLDAMQVIVPLTWELPKTSEADSLRRRAQILDGEMLARARKRQAQPPTVAKAEKEIEYEKETITEPTPSPEVESRQAGKIVPTGKLDPTNAKEALEIIRLHKQGGGGPGGVFETKWDKDVQMFEGKKGGYVVSSVEYTSKQVDTAYRTIQKPVESPMPDTDLFAMPGKEAQMKAIAQKMAKVKGVVRPKKKGPKPLTKPTALPKAKTKIEDHIKAVYQATSKEETRYAINGVKVEGDIIVATDGRRMFWAKGKWGKKDGVYLDVTSLKKGLLGKLDKTKQKFPTWRDIVPDVSDQKPILVPSGGVYEDLDTVFRRVRQAASITTEESRGITIIENKDGSLGFAAAAPEVGHVEINVNPGGKILGALNPQFLMDVIKYHAIRGDRAFELYFSDPTRPILTKSLGGKTNTLTMPINVGEPTEALKKAISEWPTKAAQVKPKGGGAVGDIGVSGATGIDTGRIKVSMEPGAKPQTAGDIIDYMSRAFGIVIRGKATHHKQYLGWFDPKATGIRLKDVRSLTTGTHEVAHHIDWTLNNRISLNPPSKLIADELMALGRALYGSKKPPGGYKSEGWAEFIREYLTGEDAKEKAPNLYKWFTDEYLTSHKDMAKKIAKTRDMITKWRLQGAEARVDSQINKKQVKGPLSEWFKRGLLWIETSFRDEFAPIKRAMIRAGIKEGELTPAEDPYQIAVARADKAGAVARQFVLEYTTDMAGNRTGKGLREILEPVAKEINIFTRWIITARARLLHKKGINPGISRADAEYVYEKYDNEIWRDALKELTAWNHRVLDYLVEAGGLDTQAANTIKKSNPIYIPFMRAFKEGELRMAGGYGKGVAKVTKPIKKIKGSGREIIDPIESMIKQTQKIIAVAHKAEIAKAIANLATKKGTASMIWKVPAPKQATRFEAEQLKKDIARIAYERMGLDPQEISSAMLEHWDDVLTVYSNAGQYYGKDNIVALVINGKREWYEVDPALYKAIEGVDQYTLPWFLSITFGKATRMVRLGATGLNPSFGLIRNFLRDAMTFTVLSKHAKAGPISAVKGIAEDIIDTPTAKKFKAMGGKMSSQILADRKAVQHLKKHVLASTVSGKTIYTVAHPIDALRELFGVTEAGTRIGEYGPALKAAEKKYGEGSKDAAIYALNQAQDVTTNFSRHGKIAKVLNQMIPFFNAAIQGPDKIIRTFGKRPLATSLKAILALTIPAIWSWWKYKDEEWYINMPVYERVNYLHFRIPGTEVVIRLPVPFELGHIFQSAPIAAIDAWYRKDPKIVSEMFEESLRQANPFDWPATFRPIIDIMANEDFADRPIVSKSAEYKLPEDQYGNYTTELMKVIGKTIGYSPAKLEHLVASYSGGLYTRVARTIDLRNKKEITKSDMPILGTLFLREPYAPRAQLSRFYEKRDLLNQKYSSKKITGKEKRLRKRYNEISGELSGLWKKLPDAKTQKDKIRIYQAMKRQLNKIRK